ncbi:MAG: excinuclease ABC subunit UvrC [Elusimicrobia bacterium]|nr:excinuclease ABC subunit UvrC [Elusimicrobiota bacterium]
MNELYDQIPAAPGVYLMRDASDKIIYAGKAVNLKKRVSSYFQKTNIGPKIQALVNTVRRIDYVRAQSEREALVLEEALIKKYQPVYNAMWKDDKSYPYAVLSMQEDFPRLYLARKKHIPPGAKAFGPYPNVSRIKALVRSLFRSGRLPLRPCRWDFSRKQPLAESKIKSCLYFHTGQCPAPCAGRISFQNYRALARKAEVYFSGRRLRYGATLRRQMTAASKNWDFEKAAGIKKELEALDHIGERLGLFEIQAEALGSLYDPKEGVRGLQEALGLKKPPAHIEAFDISIIQGAFPVGSSVCFVGGRPNKSHYRRFRIRDVAGMNDFEMMKEVVRRRIFRLREEKEEFPDLMLIDGGAGQLSMARQAMAEVMGPSGGPALVSLAKQEEILCLDSAEERPFKEVRLPKTNPGLKMCMWIRDEAHRFAITYHRKLRQEGMTRS